MYYQYQKIAAHLLRLDQLLAGFLLLIASISVNAEMTSQEASKRLTEINHIATDFILPTTNITFNDPATINDGYNYADKWVSGNTTLHAGEDINTTNDCGRAVLAIGKGIVIASAHGGASWGGIISIQHRFLNKNGVYQEIVSQYAHIAPLDSIKEGSFVDVGQKIGYIADKSGNTCSSSKSDNPYFAGVSNSMYWDVTWSPHLHFEIRTNTDLTFNKWFGLADFQRFAPTNCTNISSASLTCRVASVDKAGYTDPLKFINSKPANQLNMEIKDFWIKSGEIFEKTPSGFDAQFKLINKSTSTMFLSQVALALHKVDAAKTYLKDMKLFNNINLNPNVPWQTGKIVTDTPTAGDYLVIAKIYQNNTWVTLGEQKITIKSNAVSGNCPSSLGTFNPNIIIPENEVKFFEIPEAQIRAFLSNQGGVLSSLDMTLAKLATSSYPFDPVENTKRGGKTASQFYTTVTNPLARWGLQELANNTPTNQRYDAAKLIYLTAKENKMNPVLLLAFLQKEQSLISSASMNYSGSVLLKKLNEATGYGVKGSGTDLTYYGFLAQIAGTSWDMTSKMNNGTSFARWATDYATSPNDEENLFKAYSSYRQYFMSMGYSPCATPSVVDKIPTFSSVTLPTSVTVPGKLYFTGALSDDKGLSMLSMMVSGPKGNDILGFSNTLSGTSVSLSSYYFDSSSSTYAGTPGVYTVTLWAKDNAGQAVEGARFTVTVQGGSVNAPTNLRVSFSGTSYTLAWNDNSSNEAGFKIERSTDNKAWQEVGSTVSNIAQISGSTVGITSGTKVYFRVRAFSGSTYSGYSNVLEFVVPSVKTLSSVNVTCPASVNENSSASCSAVASFSDGSTTSSGFSWSENSSYASISSSGTLTTSSVSSDQSVAVTASYTHNGTTKSGSKTLTIKDVVALDSMKFVTDSPKDDTVFNGGDSFDKSWVLQNTGTSTWNSSYCLNPVTGGSSLGSVKACVSGTVAPGASHTFVVKMKAPIAQATEMTYRQDWRLTNAAGVRVGTYDVYARIKVKGGAKTLSSVNVTCPASVNENSSASCSAIASFSDGSTTSSGFSWSENSSYASISSSGTLTTSSVSSDQSVAVTASYTHNGTTKSGSKTLTIKDVPPAKTLSSVNVTCPASVNENSSVSCSAVASFSDGSTTSSGFSWSENSSYASISSSGTLTTSSVSSDQSMAVMASYTHNGTTKSGSKTLTIKDVPPAYDGKDPISMGCDSDATTVASKIITGGVIELRYSKKCGTNWARTRANSSSSSTYAKVTRNSDGRSYSYSGKGSIYTAMVYSPTTVSCAEGKIGTASASGACK
ncbi:NBR1-Ig-like domain-containing protein [Thiothrix sp. UBA2016]|uniref:NBR1-Ig-like domain-containing protein n=2 Tax=unclassified Thiothrix TaxID=2636184 RepID=UPI0025D2EA98|nr:DUF2690 domain-containing protein [Thiothrix sp. UBA2016]